MNTKTIQLFPTNYPSLPIEIPHSLNALYVTRIPKNPLNEEGYI